VVESRDKGSKKPLVSLGNVDYRTEAVHPRGPVRFGTHLSELISGVRIRHSAKRVVMPVYSHFKDPIFVDSP
jgi:hypothetical protein